MEIADWKAYCKQHVTAGYTPGGDAANIPKTGKRIAEFLIGNNFVRPGYDILDVGNGNGRLAIGLSLALERFTYYGLDVIQPCVQFCQEAFSGDRRFKFAQLDVSNQHYWAMGRGQPEQVVFPTESAAFDTVVAFSLFTHLDTPAAVRRYLNEMTRSLRPGGGIFATWSFTTMRDQIAINAKHAIYHINDVIQFYAPFKSWRLVELRSGVGSPHQVGIWATT